MIMPTTNTPISPLAFVSKHDIYGKGPLWLSIKPHIRLVSILNQNHLTHQSE